MVTKSHIPQWPELLRPGTAAAMLDLAESTFRNLFPILAAHFGLKVYDVCGPKFRRDNLLRVIKRLRDEGRSVSVRKSEGVVQIGGDEYKIKGNGLGRRGQAKEGQVMSVGDTQ